MINLIYIRHIFLFFHLSIISHESFACNACWECLTYCCPGTTQNNTTVASQESTIIPNDTSIEFSAIPTTENEVELNISKGCILGNSIRLEPIKTLPLFKPECLGIRNRFIIQCLICIKRRI